MMNNSLIFFTHRARRDTLRPWLSLTLARRLTLVLWLPLALTLCVCGSATAGSETLTLPTRDGEMKVYLYRPVAQARELPVVIVLHGVKRDAARARDQWISAADRYHFMIIAPQFSNQHYPGARGYMLGNTASGHAGAQITGSGPLPVENAAVPSAQWSYSRIGDIFSQLQRRGITRRRDYLLYGHSAGCQFVHRLLMALPGTPARAAVCASAGWWTPPDSREPWPYGLTQAPFQLNAADQARFFARPTLILVGGDDTRTQHTEMRQTPQALAQGDTRRQRAIWYFNQAQATARSQVMPFHWQFIIVPGAGHQSSLLVDQAARFLYRFSR